MRSTKLRSEEEIPLLGQGTWHLAENPRHRDDEISALRLGLNVGMTLIDTAELYGDGAAEELVAEAIDGQRDDVFLVSKVLPQHATRRGTIAACKASLQRLRTDRIDLYLLHWRGEIPLQDTLEGFDALVRDGTIRYWGVSNFDVADMEDLFAAGGQMCAMNQMLYNLSRRGVEYDLMPWCRNYRIPIMAYSPIEQGRILDHSALRTVADQHNATPAQIALAWVLRHEDVAAIPKMGKPSHVRENFAALGVHLTKHDLTLLDLAFPAPTRKLPLEMI